MTTPNTTKLRINYDRITRDIEEGKIQKNTQKNKPRSTYEQITNRLQTHTNSKQTND